jgi:hypothetical protein
MSLKDISRGSCTQSRADMIACHYEDIWTKLPKMKFAKSQAEREELAK